MLYSASNCGIENTFIITVLEALLTSVCSSNICIIGHEIKYLTISKIVLCGVKSVSVKGFEGCIEHIHKSNAN